ncbi:MAG: T9SS type A sorting domain-containing protein [Candidatus Marinimicrobia bacterium]|nr:T9SS type A sorting domain-containing protein [Candidatus Neomarinimicrobiota bacterium]
MTSTHIRLLSLTILLLSLSPIDAGQYYTLCEGNFGQANASLWSLDGSLITMDGPLLWNTSSNPLGDVGQSLSLLDHKLYLVMNGSHEIRVVNLESGAEISDDIDLPDSSPRYMAIHHETGRGYVSSWNLGALLILDLNTSTIIDTFLLNALPEQLLIEGDDLFVSIPMHTNWSGNNKVLQINLAGSEPEVIQSYDVIEGPGAMALINDQLYVTSIYYNDAWETFSGTSRINLTTHSIVSMDHGYYTNYSADIEIIQGEVYRTYGNSIVPLNEDLSLNLEASIGDFTNVYTFSVANDKILIGSSDFVAPDQVGVYSLTGESLGNFNVGALPSDFVYYNPDLVSAQRFVSSPPSFELYANYPNPFNPSTSIPFEINSLENMSLNIYDLQGRLVVSLIDAHLQPGKYSSSWDGQNMHGEPVSSGIYHAVLSSTSQQVAIKVTLLR